MMANRAAVDAASTKGVPVAAVHQDQDWQAEVIDLKRRGLESKDIAEAVGKHAATVRKVIAKAREAGDLPSDPLAPVEAVATALDAVDAARDAVATARELSEPIPGQIDIEGNEAPEADRDPLEDFKAEAGEAVGDMPPAEPDDTDPDMTVRLKGTRQMAIDFGPAADIPVGGTLVIKSEKLASGHFGLGDVITGTFTARITDAGGKERLDKASEEFRAKPTAYTATITELGLDA